MTRSRRQKCERASITTRITELVEQERTDAEELAAAFTHGMVKNGVLEKLWRWEAANERAIKRCYEAINLLKERRHISERPSVIIDLEVVSEDVAADQQSKF